MQRQFKIVCRGSKLSLAQAGIFERKLLNYDPGLKIELIVKETRGDAIQDLPLQDIEGIDFFTRDIQDYLLSGQADFAVHSLKDVSGENFFQGTHYAIIEREDPRDVVIFDKEVVDKLESGNNILLGTSSPRRVNMATEFLIRALPMMNNLTPVIGTDSIRGNVDSRLKKLDAGLYDGIILACAGLNRLLNFPSSRDEVTELLSDKRLMILPLLDCPPAPGQGAIVAETTPGNDEAIQALRFLNDNPLAKAVDQERKIAHRYGAGCHQQFGVIHIESGGCDFVFAAGKDQGNRDFVEYFSMDGNVANIKRETISVDPADHRLTRQNIQLVGLDDTADFIQYRRQDGVKNLWVTETGIWYDLARKGWWVEGSLEGYGLPFVERTLTSPLLSRRSNSTIVH